MGWNRKSIGAWAGSVTDALLRHDDLTGLPDAAVVAPIVADPAGSPCSYTNEGHTADPWCIARADELRHKGVARPVRCADSTLIEAGSLTWRGDAVAGSDPDLLVARLLIEQGELSMLTVLTHDQRAVAAIEACEGVGLWWVPRHWVLFVPSWTDTIDPIDRAAEPTGYAALSVVVDGTPWRPCPIAPRRANARNR